MPDSQPMLVDAQGRPIRTPKTAVCPRCGAAADQRVASSGFGTPHDVCRTCAFEFAERTV